MSKYKPLFFPVLAIFVFAALALVPSAQLFYAYVSGVYEGTLSTTGYLTLSEAVSLAVTSFLNTAPVLILELVVKRWYYLAPLFLNLAFVIVLLANIKNDEITAVAE